jgi:hypothetical protein
VSRLGITTATKILNTSPQRERGVRAEAQRSAARGAALRLGPVPALALRAGGKPDRME